jgi:hypothetical protein
MFARGIILLPAALGVMLARALLGSGGAALGGHRAGKS